MSDLIDREDVIRIAQDRLNSPYMQNKWQQGACLSILRAIEELPSADVVSLEEFEQMRFLADKSMEMVGEERPKEELTDVLAELHERFDALEKELRKASAEMSAVIREYVDRPKGKWIDEHGNRIPMTEHSAYCSHCGEWSEYLTDYCGNCGAEMDGEREDE